MTLTVNEHGYLERPGLGVLIFHNFYPEGKQGGVEIIQHEERVASCGDLRLQTAPGQWDPLPKVGERSVDTERAVISVPVSFEQAGICYKVTVCPEGQGFRVRVDLDAPLPSEWVGQAGFNLELYPSAFFGKSYQLGGKAAIFPQQANGPMALRADGTIESLPLAVGAKLVAAAEDPFHHLSIESYTGELALYDGRDSTQNGWFVVRELLAAGATERALEWVIVPNAVPDWQRPPMVSVSVVGYHPSQVKQALIELDPRAELPASVALRRIEPAGGGSTVLEAAPVLWGRFLRYTYARFDFTEVRTPGLYMVCCGDQCSPPFPIASELYAQSWRPTLETYFPVQMCHMAVRDRYRIWHGACHMDDALQAPTSHTHFDGYRQYEDTETPYAPFTHVPHLNVGGWHDAGDYDLAAGSQARTTYTLALIRELFGVDSDQTTVKQDEHLVILHTPDGVPDIVGQVAHGVLNLLSGYRAAGHSFHGIIESTIVQYVHLGDGATMTDNHIYDAGLAPHQIRCDAEGAIYSSVKDDRWVFTNHDTALEYLVAAALAASSRVLRGYEDTLAGECLATALRIWEYEGDHAPVVQSAGYVPRGIDAQKALAASELLITTGEARFRDALLALWALPDEGRFPRSLTPWARTLSQLGGDFAADFRIKLAQAQAKLEPELAKNPFGIAFYPHIWGIGWQILSIAVELYHAWSVCPDLIDPEAILRVVNYIHGCHPVSNTSLVSGVGAKSALVAYGVNRDDWSYIPGGVPSGPALIRPDFPEYKEPFPYLWQQTEYVMPGAASYMFCALAADRILNAKP